MAKLRIEWSDLAETSVTTGAGGSGALQDFSTARGMLTPGDAQAEKPFLVYLTSTDEDDRVAQDVIESTTLKDERVSLASKLFTMVKADGQQITKDHPFYRWIGGRQTPRFILFTSAGDRVGKLEGRASPSKLYALMKKTAVRDFKVNVDRFVKDYQKVLTSLDKINTLKMALAQKESRKLTKAQSKDLEKKKTEIAADEEDLRAVEEKLLTFRRRNTA